VQLGHRACCLLLNHISVAAAMPDLTRLFLQADKVIEASHPCNWFDSGSVLAADPRRGPWHDHVVDTTVFLADRKALLIPKKNCVC
jgi:hypothetical protein